jgi:pilus assembly protein TadC
MLALCLASGLNLHSAIGRVGRDLHHAHPALAEELHITQEIAALRNLGVSLERLADRVPLDDLRNLSLLLAQSDRLGCGAENALLEFSDNFRSTLRQRAESRANRTSFWMLFPTIFCLLVSAAIVLIGPPVLEFSRRRNDGLDGIRRSRPEIERLKPHSDLKP